MDVEGRGRASASVKRAADSGCDGRGGRIEGCRIGGWQICLEAKMKAGRIVVLALSVLGLAGPAAATTWAPHEVDDPFAKGNKCAVNTPASSGSYTMFYPSKFDGVYWPHTAPEWIWYCETSGFVSFGGRDEFGVMEPELRKEVAAYLKEHHDPKKPPATDIEKLQRMERLYDLRAEDGDFFAWFYRVMAYWLREDEKVARPYWEKALPLMEKELESIEGPDRMQRIYVIGEYHRRLGRPDIARERFAEVRSFKWKDKEGNDRVGAPYFDEIVADREKLLPPKAPAKAKEDEKDKVSSP